MAEYWRLNQANRIVFVMVDNTNTEVAGLGGGFTLELCKAAGAFAASAGTKAEIANGWYTYLATASEADTIGPIAVKVTGAGAVQQNLAYVVQQYTPQAIAFTYTVTNSQSGLPVSGVEVWITTDSAGLNVVLSGLTTDASGIARDGAGLLPYLDPGSYYFWRQRANYEFGGADLEVVS